MTAPAMAGLFHTGIIVPDLDAAMRDLGEALGIRWVEPLESEGFIQVRGGPGFRRSRITFSVEGPHHIELIQQLDNTAWRAVRDGPLVHHLGFTVADLAGESERLVRLGFSREAWNEEEHGGLVRYAYHHNPHGGIFIELVEKSQREIVDRWLRTGRPPS
jgi:hypothetical protein